MRKIVKVTKGKRDTLCIEEQRLKKMIIDLFSESM